MSIILIAGAWVLATFVLQNYYYTLLISYVTSPNPQPLIKSIYDLRYRPELKLVTNKNINTDAILTVHIFIGFFSSKLTLSYRYIIERRNWFL